MTETTLHKARPGWVVAALCTGTALSALNSGMIAVSLSTLRGAFHVGVAEVTWVISAYYLTSAALQPLMGRLADRYGPRRIFLSGLAIVIVAGALGPFAPTLVWVCIARVVLAIGTATTFPAAAAMLRSVASSTGASAPTLIGRIQLIDTSAAAVGPVIGGVLIVLIGWEAVFWINVPLAVIAMVGTSLIAPRDAPRAKVPISKTLRDSDIPGVIAFCVTIAALLVFLLGLAHDTTWYLLAVAATAGGLFAWRELRSSAPFIDVRMVAANAPLLRVYALFAMSSLVLYSALFGLPQYLEDHAGYSTAVVGLLLAPLAAFNAALAGPVERLIRAWGLRATLNAGTVALALGTLGLPVLVVSTAPWVALAATALIGIPYVVVLVSLTQSLYNAAPPEMVGQAAGLFQTARSLGCIGAPIVVGLSFARGTDPPDWTVLAFAIVGLAVLLAVVTTVTGRRVRPGSASPA